MKIVIVHDWLVTVGGAEKVLSQILAVYPEADIFSIIDFIPEDKRHILRYKTVKTSFIQKLPFAKTKYRLYLPLMVYAIEQFDLSSYDLVISSSHAVAKGVITGPNQLHICYCHTPMRYAWDLQHQYLQENRALRGVKSLVMRWLLHKIRIWDLRTANGVDYFIANSKYIGKRIYKCYRRESSVIYPNVDTTNFVLDKDIARDNFYLTASRFVPYKKLDLIIKSFRHMPDKKLLVVGTGPDFEKCKKNASNNVTLLGFQDDATLISLMQTCRAFIFAAEEDFGITPVEAQSCGAPVIAYGRGGALETTIDLKNENPTGVLFYEQTEAAIVDAVNLFEKNIDKFDAIYSRNNADKYSTHRFKSEMHAFIAQKVKQHFEGAINTQQNIEEKIHRIKVSICIPTLNAMTHSAVSFIPLLTSIKSANLHRVLIIDSASTDNTVEVVNNYGFETCSIKREEFDHGVTRQYAASILRDSDYVIYLTQDVLMIDRVSIDNLVEYTIKYGLSAAYGRQNPHFKANILAKHLRHFNYGKQSYIRSFNDRFIYGLKSAFTSNSFAIYSLKDLFDVGGFPDNVLFGEDMYLSSQLLQNGYKVGYCANAVVWHSHDYNIVQNFKRYFDTGVFHKTYSSLINQFGAPEKEGVRFVRSALFYLLKRNVLYIPSFILHTCAKYLGYRLGLHYKSLGIKWCRRFSMHPHSKFWNIRK